MNQVTEVGQCTIITGDNLETLRLMPDSSVHCCVTSPPYYALRDYKMPGQAGLEATPEEYIACMVTLFRELRRVLRDDGTFWLNLGDSYAANRGYQVPDSKHVDVGNSKGASVPPGLKVKDMIGIPWRVALALQADGWYLRAAAPWLKRNAMPESAKDRPTTVVEYFFLLTKTTKYYYDGAAVKVPYTKPLDRYGGPAKKVTEALKEGSPQGRVRRTSDWFVESWQGMLGDDDGYPLALVVNPQGYPGAHFATFPPKLVEPCILAGTSEKGACPHCGAPWVRMVEKGAPDLAHQQACGGDANGAYDGQSTKDYAAAGAQDASATKARILAGMKETVTTGWLPTCACPAHDPAPCVVIDPFGGAATTGLMANRHNRNSIMLELNPEYVALAAARLQTDLEKQSGRPR